MIGFKGGRVRESFLGVEVIGERGFQAGGGKLVCLYVFFRTPVLYHVPVFLAVVFNGDWLSEELPVAGVRGAVLVLGPAEFGLLPSIKLWLSSLKRREVVFIGVGLEAVTAVFGCIDVRPRLDAVSGALAL